jgi:predicted CopG family antitoxin
MEERDRSVRHLLANHSARKERLLPFLSALESGRRREEVEDVVEEFEREAVEHDGRSFRG